MFKNSMNSIKRGCAEDRWGYGRRSTYDAAVCDRIEGPSVPHDTAREDDPREGKQRKPVARGVKTLPETQIL